MNFFTFQGLLRAGLRWRMRDHELAVAAASYPYLKKADQQRARTSMQGAARPGPSRPSFDDERPEALEGFKRLTALQAARFPMTEETMRVVRGEQ